MIILRDKTIVRDRRLDRIVEFDDRSRNYPIRGFTAKRIPKTVMWDCRQTLDQKNEGACVGFGCGHEILADPVPVKGITNQYAREVLYWGAQKADEWPGGAYPGAEEFYEGTSVLAGLDFCKSIGYWESYYWGFSLEDLILGLQVVPAILGLTWREGMMDTDAQGYIRVEGEEMGGHCILCRGYDAEVKRFVLRNSWGPDWGVNSGDCYVSQSDMEKALADQGEQAFPMGMKDPTEPIEPEPEPESNCSLSSAYMKFGNVIAEILGSRYRVHLKKVR